MDMGTVGWIALGWFAVALVLSVVLGGFLRKTNETPGDEELAVDVSRQKVMRYMRGRKPVIAACNVEASQPRATRRRRVASAG